MNPTIIYFKNRKYFIRGEIATLLTIGTLVFLGVSALTSSLMLKNKQTTSSKATDGGCLNGTVDVGECSGSYRCVSSNENYKYDHLKYDSACLKLFSSNLSHANTAIYWFQWLFQAVLQFLYV